MRLVNVIVEPGGESERYEFKAGTGIAEFVRLSDRDGQTGFLFPHPEARFYSDSQGRVFKSLTEENADAEMKAHIEPLFVDRTPDDIWTATVQNPQRA